MSRKLATEQLEYVTIADIDLTAAHTDTEYKLPGFFDTLVVESLTGSLSIRLNSKTSGSIDLSKSRVINAKFDRFFYTNTAQAGAAVTLQVGADASFGVLLQGARPATFPGWGGLLGSQVTTAAYVVLNGPDDWRTIVKGTLVLRETGGVNGALYQIQGTLDGTNFVTIKTDQPLVASGIVYETITDLWVQIVVNIKDAIGGNHATVEVRVYNESLL